MTKLVSKITLGIDVAKDELVICEFSSGEIITLSNQPEQINTWLKSLCGPVRIALEPTGHYHMVMVAEALALDYEVYLVNPRQLSHYREAVNVRNKTDPLDAGLLARYLAHEAESLRPFRPQCRQAHQLWSLLKRRATVVAARKQIQQSFRGVQLSNRALMTQFIQLLQRIDLKILKLIRALGWLAEYRCCLSIPGIGPLNAAALVAAYHRGAFAGSDAFIAFIGMDVRIRESGCYKGKRRLTKRGDSELRRLLYCATQAARNYQHFDAYYQRQRGKGLSKIASKVILARKLARIAFALIKKQETFIRQENPAG